MYHDSLVNQKNKSGRAGSIVMPIASCQSSVRIFRVAYAGLMLEKILEYVRKQCNKIEDNFEVLTYHLARRAYPSLCSQRCPVWTTVWVHHFSASVEFCNEPIFGIYVREAESSRQ